MEVRTSQGWFSRIGDSFGGALFGFLLFCASFALLFWNEGRAVKRAQDLEFGAENVVKAAAAVDPKNEGKLIHVTGDVTAQGQPIDNDFGVTAKAVLLDRQVEMYQWKEKTSTEKDKKLGGSEQTVTKYTYDKVWSTELFDSGSFRETAGHTNPNRMPYSNQLFIASGVKLGAYTLDHKLVDELDTDTDLVPAPTKLPANARVVGGQIYIGGNPQSPTVGDVRVTYRIAPFGKHSVVGGQKNGTLDEFVHKELNDPVALVARGIQTPEMMFKAAEDGNAMMTLILRAVGFLMMFFGLRLMGRPLSVLADVLPFLGSAVGFVTGFVSFFIALGLSFVTIAVAWIFYRPLVGLALLLVAGGAIAAAVMFSRKKSQAVA